VDWRVETGVMRVEPRAAARRDALFVSGFLQQTFGPVTPVMSASATVAGDSVAAAQMILAASVVPPWSARLPFDVGALVALYGIAAGDRGISRTAFARQHVLNERGGYWLGASVAQTERDRAYASDAVELGAWRAIGIARFTAVLSTARTTDADLFQGTLRLDEPTAPKLRIADATLVAKAWGDRVEVEGVMGLRAGLEGVHGERAFGVLSVAVRAWSDVFVVASGGSQLADPMRGTPEWRFVALGLRFASDATDGRVRRSRLGPAAAAQRMVDGRVRIVVAAPPTATRVEIAGTFTGWEPVALQYGPEGWSVLVNASPGSHQLQVRVGGGGWRVPANLPVVADEFGQRAGLIVLP
jgi:hypothetical protein